MTKLRLWEFENDYDRILYLDSDIWILNNIDDVFYDPATHKSLTNPYVPIPGDELPPPATYILAAADRISANEDRKHSIPKSPESQFSSSFMVIKPSKQMFDRYMSIYGIEGRTDGGNVDTALLNYAHNKTGPSPTPWSRLEPSKWVTDWPSMLDYKYGTSCLHERFWQTGVDALKEVYEKDMQNMKTYFLYNNRILE